MSGVEAAVIAAGKAIAERAAREWLATRAAKEQRGAKLKDLVQGTFRDRILRRKFDNQVEGIALAVEDRLRVLVEREFRGLEDNDRGRGRAAVRAGTPVPRPILRSTLTRRGRGTGLP
ncbi:hypothetical protein AB0B45_33475 [Nonomuraea sp. NPDC049152]|uniref:NACHT N-terminal Helical domain 1-containing protein n=1 Tax=Nonomuraea sp. NPDC049152 TaxID=3154350 RepID=UPI0033FC90C1